MARKRITLVKNMQEIIDSKDLEAFKEVFTKCEIWATGGGYKKSALHYHGITDEMVRWFVDNGGNIEAVDTYQRTPLHSMSGYPACSIDVLLELGANVHAKETYGNTPLHDAADRNSMDKIQKLLEHGADPFAKNNDGQTPFEYVLSQMEPGYIDSFYKIVPLFMSYGIEITDKMRAQIKQLGEKFEFYRPNSADPYLKETEDALNGLHKIFGVEPVPKRRVHDGTYPITVTATTWQEQADELWDLLVPGNGAASTVQGEAIRICGKVTREILDNGGGNWSREYKKLPQALPQYCAMGNQLDKADHEEFVRLAKGICASSSAKELYRLEELVVKWVLVNPTPIPLASVDYKR